MDYTTELDLDMLAEEMSRQLTYDEILDFIQALDIRIAEWNFTEKLYKWAKKEHKAFKAEM